ncbi:MAG: hypothetical protein AAGI51_18385 [Pseudomonadota bacterium]
MDHPFRLHPGRATKRRIKSLFVGRPDGPEGCPMWRVTFRLYRMMWRLHRDLRPKLVEAIERHADRIRIVRIASPAELNASARNPV